MDSSIIKVKHGETSNVANLEKAMSSTLKGVGFACLSMMSHIQALDTYLENLAPKRLWRDRKTQK